jgi:hypothetical protein
MSIDNEIMLARRFFRDMRNVMTDEQLMEIAKMLWDLNNYDEVEPCFFSECFVHQIFNHCSN